MSVDWTTGRWKWSSDLISMGDKKIDEIWMGNTKIYPEGDWDWRYIDMLDDTGVNLAVSAINLWTDGLNIYYTPELSSMTRSYIFDKLHRKWKHININSPGSSPGYCSFGRYVYYDYVSNEAYMLNPGSYSAFGPTYTFNKSTQKWFIGDNPFNFKLSQSRFAKLDEAIRLPDKGNVLFYEGQYLLIPNETEDRSPISDIFDNDVGRCYKTDIWSDLKNIYATKASWHSAYGFEVTNVYKYNNGIFETIHLQCDDGRVDKLGTNVWSDGIDVYTLESCYNYAGSQYGGLYYGCCYKYDVTDNIWKNMVMSCLKRNGQIVYSNTPTSRSKYRNDNRDDLFPISGGGVWTDGTNIYATGADGDTYIYKKKYNHVNNNYYIFHGISYGSGSIGNNFYKK